MDTLLDQLHTLYAQSDQPTRLKIQASFLEMQSTYDTDWDLVIRLASAPPPPPHKTGTDLSLFTTLSSSHCPLSLFTLATQTHAAPKLLAHLLRAMASFSLIAQPIADTSAANRTTHVLANHVAGGIAHAYNIHVPSTYALPAWLQDREYQEVSSNRDLPFHRALKTDLAPFEWMKRHPEQLESLGHAMAIQREENWTESFPVLEEIGDFKADADSALMVDIGGGFGEQAQAFKKKFPDLEGKIVVQDISGTLEHAPKVERLEFQAHNFFKEQPIKGAKFYYLRHILHDWTDEDSIRILKAIVPAMGPNSSIVIDEVVLPDEKLLWQAVYMDLTMMASLGGVERTRKEFETILDASGLQILKVHKYDHKFQSVLFAGLK